MSRSAPASGIEFDWRPAKCAKNIAERGIDFADVLEAFADPDRKLAEDTRRDYGDILITMLARIKGRIFHITYTERGGLTWIISAHKANQREQRRYEQGQGTGHPGRR